MSDQVQEVSVPRLKTRYQKEIVPALVKEFSYSNVMQVPRLVKISVNIGLGESLQNSKAIEAATGDLAIITGQKPVVTKARKSIAIFKLREGVPIGAMVTLRGNRMWDFLDRVINYSLGLREQLVFPEIDYDKIDKIRGMELTVVTTANSDEEARRLLALMDMPFKRG